MVLVGYLGETLFDSFHKYKDISYFVEFTLKKKKKKLPKYNNSYIHHESYSSLSIVRIEVQ